MAIDHTLAIDHTSDDSIALTNRNKPHGRGILIAGTSSDAGKSLLVAGLCRAIKRRGIDVAPFKAQNMSNNSMVCPDGTEIGRAQYLQAIAAEVTPSSLLNPVLLKPGTDRRSHIVLRGQPAGTLEAGQYATGRTQLRDAAWAAYRELTEQHELIIVEGAGSPAEINLRSGDYVNLGLAREFNLPVVVVGDIDRGGILASLYGTWALVDEADRACLRGFVINKFRGDQAVLDPGLAEITRRTGVPFFGVMPYLPNVWLDGEDALAFAKWPRITGSHGTLNIVVIGLPRISNATDLDALAAEPGVAVSVTTTPAAIADADLVILPGTRSTLGDLAWLHGNGCAAALIKRAQAGRPILGICGGYQMLGQAINDPVECGATAVDTVPDTPGLGLLPTRTDFSPEKQLGITRGSWQGHNVTGYEIHHGVVSPIDTASDPITSGNNATVLCATSNHTTNNYASVEPFLDGYRAGNTFGSIWHGTMENDYFRRAFLTEIAKITGNSWQPDVTAPGFKARRELMITNLADAIEEHLDVNGLLELTNR